MSSDKHVQFLEGMANQHPALADDLSELAGLYERKLWHQLTLKLEECSSKPAFQEGDVLVQLYDGFVDGFALKLNGLKLAMFAVVASKQFADPKDGVVFLEKVIKKVGLASVRGWRRTTGVGGQLAMSDGGAIGAAMAPRSVTSLRCGVEGGLVRVSGCLRRAIGHSHRGQTFWLTPTHRDG